MATVSYTISGAINDNWSGTFVVSNASSPIATGLPSDLTAPGFNFTPQEFAAYDLYVTWRSVDISTQPSGPPSFLNIYPTSGYSFDLWCPQLVTDAKANRTWNFLNGKTYALNPNKNTVIYNYDLPCHVRYAIGGNIQFTVA
jgi:hypothetical protein